MYLRFLNTFFQIYSYNNAKEIKKQQYLTYTSDKKFKSTIHIHQSEQIIETRHYTKLKAANDRRNIRHAHQKVNITLTRSQKLTIN